MPVAAVSPFGMPTMSLGSFTASVGVIRQSTIAIFTCRVSSVMMQKRVISAPVPAVVFTATIGIIGLVLLSTPS